MVGGLGPVGAVLAGRRHHRDHPGGGVPGARPTGLPQPGTRTRDEARATPGHRPRQRPPRPRMIALLVITDGRRDCIQQTIPSALASLQGPITRRVIYDDSGDETHRRWLRNMFPSFDLIWHQDG